MFVKKYVSIPPQLSQEARIITVSGANSMISFDYSIPCSNIKLYLPPKHIYCYVRGYVCDSGIRGVMFFFCQCYTWCSGNIMEVKNISLWKIVYPYNYNTCMVVVALLWYRYSIIFLMNSHEEDYGPLLRGKMLRDTHYKFRESGVQTFRVSLVTLEKAKIFQSPSFWYIKPM